MSITRLFVSRPTLAFVVIALVAIIGLTSALTLIQEQFPVVDLPVVTVQYSYIGASTTEMRDAIVRPVEDSIAGAPDLDYLTSNIQQGQATISATFRLASDKNADLIATQQRVQSAQSLLPTDVRAPSVESFDPSQSVVMTMVVSSQQVPEAELASTVIHHLIPEIEEIPDISNVEAQGNVTPALVVTADPARLSANSVTINDVINTVSSNNARTPGGYLTSMGKEASIDVRGDIQTPESILNLLLTGPATSNTGATNPLDPWTTADHLLHINDVASVARSYEPPRSYAFFQSRPAIELNIYKATGASEVTASQSVLTALPRLKREYPRLNLIVSQVQSDYTEQQLQGVIHALLEGIILTGVVMLFFLRSWRNAVVVMVAIPISLGITLGVMRLANFTIDVVSLLAMTLIIGILVDDSIVVLENTERHREMGDAPHRAALRGRNEIGLAALVITLVDVVVFAPIAFLPGIVGKFLNEFGLVVVVATLSSLFVSFTITPTLAGNWSLLSTWKPPAFIDRFTRGFDRVRDWYVNHALIWGIAHPRTVVGFSLLAVICAVALIPLGLVGFEFIPSIDRGQLAVQISFPTGTSIAETRRLTLNVEHYLDTIGPDLQNEIAIAGGTESQLGGIVNQGSRAQINVTLADTRTHSTDYWTSEFRTHIPRLIPHAEVLVIPATGTGGGVTQPIVYVVKASGSGDPTAAAVRVAKLMSDTPGAVNVNSGSAALSPQIEVQFNRDAARALNVTLSDAASAVRAAFGGDTVTQYVSPDGLEDVVVIYPTADETNISSLRSIALRSANGSLIHLGDIAELRSVPAPVLLARQDRVTVVTIGANVAPGYAQSNVTRAFEKRLPSLHLPSNISVGPNAGGSQQNLADTVSGIAAALVLAVTLVYLLMVALFNSYRSPAIIMFSVPVAIVGALGALALTRQTLNLFSMIGTVLLIGLVSKNGILLVDFANRARLAGQDKLHAILQAAEIRFRPIIMTTISMIAGMLPLALAIESGSETRRGLGIVVIGGLSSSLVLTLLLVPIAYLAISPKSLPATEADDF